MTASDVGPGAEFERALAPHLAVDRRITGVTCVPSAYRSSFLIDEIDVRLDDGTTMELIAKAVHWDALTAEARRAKPRFLWDPERERASYEGILSQLDIGSARYFGSYASGSGGRYLLLERIAGVPLWQHGNLEAWREAARWLARMHVRVGTARALNSPAAVHLLRYDRQFYDRWLERARAFCQDRDEDLLALADRHARVVEWLLAETATFIHGEFYASNVLIAPDDAHDGFVVRPIDWEMAALGPALMDVACLLAGQWTDADRADVTDAYFLERSTLRGRLPEREHYLKTLDCCLVHLSLRNLGWSCDWIPPPDRAHDWLGEAVRLCERWHL